MSIRIISLALAATAAFAVPAAAETQTTTRGVQYKDLDLTTDAGPSQTGRDAALDEALLLDIVERARRSGRSHHSKRGGSQNADCNVFHDPQTLLCFSRQTLIFPA